MILHVFAHYVQDVKDGRSEAVLETLGALRLEGAWVRHQPFEVKCSMEVHDLQDMM